MFELQANQQHRDGGRAGNKPARQAKQGDLPGSDVLSVETTVNILGMRALVGVLPLFFNQLMTMVVMIMMMVVVVVVVVVVIVVMVMMMLVRLALFPGAPGHPERDRNDQHARDQLEPGLRRMSIPAPTKP